jgi:flagellar biosynthetic protein FliR
MCKEIFIGVAMAFIINVVFDAARVAGNLADTMMGSNNAQLYVPQLGQQVTIYSSLKLQLSVVLFLTLNGHHIVIEALADSLVAVPLDGFPNFGQGVWPFFELAARAFADLLMISLVLSAPVVLATFLTDLGMGAINRVAQNFQVFFVAMAIKPLVAAIITAMAIQLIIQRFQQEFVSMLVMLKHAIQLLY